MKKLAFFLLGLMAVIAMSCQNTGKGGNETAKKKTNPLRLLSKGLSSN